MNQSATVSINGSADASGSKFVFARPIVEMVLVMFVGMGVLAGLAQLALGAPGSSVRAVRRPWGHSDGLSMTAPMAAWMACRGRTFARNAEMAASMVIQHSSPRSSHGRAHWTRAPLAPFSTSR